MPTELQRVDKQLILLRRKPIPDFRPLPESAGSETGFPVRILPNFWTMASTETEQVKIVNKMSRF